VTLDTLNGLDARAARDALTECCATPRWVARMLGLRPFASRDALFRASNEAWVELKPDDLHAAIAHHPRIGEAGAAMAGNARSSGWSRREQSAVERASDTVRAALAQGNLDYERRFGHRFIVCAAGKSADELLAALRARLGSDAATELATTAEELRKITTLRLEKLLA
jgi:OHCU decarboxylase